MDYTTPDGRPLMRQPNMFFWRGQYFHGLMDVERNALYDDPDDSFAAVVGFEPDDYAQPVDEK